MFGTPRTISPPEAGKFGSETESVAPIPGRFGSVFGPYLAQENGLLLLQENKGNIVVSG